MNSGFITQLEPPVLPVSAEKSEPLIVIKNEPPESEIMEIGMDDMFNTSDSKDIDIVSHTLCESLIKTETVSKTENVKIENKIESKNLIKTEDTSDDNGQEVVEVQETDKQQVLNFSNDLNDISVRSPKPEHPEKTDFAECYRTRETTSSEAVNTKMKVIKAPVIPVKSHEYITLAKNKHVCNHCQLTYKELHVLKTHIRRKHRKVTTMYQCLYCSFESKWRQSVRFHIIHKHKGSRYNLKYHYCDMCDYSTYHTGHLKSHKLIHLKPEEIQYFYCHQCSYKSKYNQKLKYHVLRHFENVENEQNLKGYIFCDKCDFKTYQTGHLRRHKLNHLKPEEIQYFYCYHCSFKSKRKDTLKSHILRHFKKEVIKFHCYICDFMTFKRELIIGHIKKKHSKVQIKSEINKGSYNSSDFLLHLYHEFFN